MRKVFERVLMAVLVLVLVINVGRLIIKQLDYHRGAEDYVQAREIAGAPDLLAIPGRAGATTSEETNPTEFDSWADEALSALAEVDLEALQAINADVIGWICIPETDLSYPILQSENNEYYLNHTPFGNGKRAPLGRSSWITAPA